MRHADFIGCRVGNADPGKFAVGLLERVAVKGSFSLRSPSR
ncbi:hypothetical protein SZ54_4948 [Rhizobium sp. UR51a]|nr:hypothetical protein SZ54_4948 [Rhizobium sp. UR51a]